MSSAVGLKEESQIEILEGLTMMAWNLEQEVEVSERLRMAASWLLTTPGPRSRARAESWNSR